MDETGARELTDEDIRTVMPGTGSVKAETDPDGRDMPGGGDGTDGDATDRRDGDAVDTDTKDADGTDTKDADGTDTSDAGVVTDADGADASDMDGTDTAS